MIAWVEETGESDELLDEILEGVPETNYALESRWQERVRAGLRREVNQEHPRIHRSDLFAEGAYERAV